MPRAARPSAEPVADEPLDPLEAHGGDPNFMTSLARGLAVLNAFPEQRRDVTIAQLAERVGFPRAAVRRCLYTLEKMGYVASEGRSFALTPKVLSLGRGYLASMPLTAIAQPFLDRVSRTVDESCSLAVLDGGEIVYVGRASTARRIMSVDLSVGSRLPAYCTSMGRVLLANLRDDRLAAYLARTRLAAHTDRTITSTAKLRETLTDVRQQGYALVDQELELGLRSIAVPVRNASGEAVAALNIGAQAARIGVREMEKRFLPVLVEAATDLGRMLRR